MLLENRAHWPTKEKKRNFRIFKKCPAYAKNGIRWPQMGPGGFFPTNPDLAIILGRKDLNFEIFCFFLIFWTSNFWISRSPDIQILVWAGLGLALGRAWAYQQVSGLRPKTGLLTVWTHIFPGFRQTGTLSKHIFKIRDL